MALEKVTLKGGQVLFAHPSGTCKGDHCTIHNPSDHHMKEWPQNWRSDWIPGFMERICPHGIGHPDPDGFLENKSHGCDGCCIPPKTELF